MHNEQALYLCSSLANVLINHVKPVPSSFRNILIIKLDEIGDMIYTLHCLKAVKKHHPESRITLFCKPVNVELVQPLRVVDSFIHVLNQKKKYDLIIDLRGTWKTLLFAITSRVNYRLDRGTSRIQNKLSGGQLHEVYTNWNCIKTLLPLKSELEMPELVIPLETKEQSKVILRNEGVTDAYVVFHCGAREEARRWPAERFAMMCDWVDEIYHISVILVGAPNEIEINAKVLALTKRKNVVNLAGKTSLLQLAALMQECKFFVGNESGPLHFATVLKKPLVALFGPGVKDVFYPLYKNQLVVHHFSIEGQINESSAHPSMLQITVDEVQAVVSQLFSN